ncbi:MAG TPA: ATP-binding protein [Longimicrobiales bacterium]
MSEGERLFAAMGDGGTSLGEPIFRQLAESIREVLWVMAPDRSRVEYVNPAFEEIFGRPREDLYRDAGKLREAILTQDRDRVADAFAALPGSAADVEYRMMRPDGEVRWIWARAVPVHDRDGTLTRIVGIAEDVTGRKETEEQQAYLAEAGRVLSSSLDYEETLRAVARLAVPHIADWCAVYVAEAGGEVRPIEVAHVNPPRVQLARQLAERYPDDPDADTGVHHVVRTGEAEFIPEITPEMIEAAARDAEHLRIIRELGLRSAMTVPMNARGRTLGAIAFIAAESGRRYTGFDLRFAEQLAARAALAVDNARLFAEAQHRAVEERALRQAAHAVSASFTVEEVIQEIAHSAVQATAADAAVVERIDEAAEMVHVVACHGDCGMVKGSTLPLQGSFAEYVLQRGAPIYIERLDAADRPLPPALVSARPDARALVIPLAEGGSAIGALFLVRHPGQGAFRGDEIARAGTFANLASLAFRKVNLLAESEERRLELERVMESRERLVRGFTHDLRNPLGAADGFLDLVESGIYGELSEQQHTALSRARRLVRSALGLIGDVLELARVEAGGLAVEPEAVDVGEVARDVVEEYRPQAEAKGLALHVDLGVDLPLVQSDASRIRQILGNLMSNAIKFTGAGHVAVQLGTREDAAAPAPGEWLAVDVSDTGPGIAREKQPLLFREFSRVGDGGPAGVGLGLAISRRLAEALGGGLTVRTEAGQGSTFTLWIPLTRTPQPANGAGL